MKKKGGAAFLPMEASDSSVPLDLKQRAVRGGTFTIASNAASFVIQILGTIILARLVSPRDYGLVTMVTTFSLLFQNFGGNGLVESVIQAPSVSHKQLSTLFWVNVGANLVLAMTFAFGAPLLAWFYHEPDLTLIAMATGLSVFSGGLGNQHLALLQRDMKFGAFSIISVISRLVGTGVAIALAMLGWGVWALVVNVVLQPLTVSIGAWIACAWRPGRPGRVRDVYPMIRFALQTYGYFMTNYVSRNLDKILVGWFFGSVMLGQYKRAYDLFVLPVSQLSSPLAAVALSGFSRLRDDPERFNRNYLKAVTLLAFVGMGLGGVLTITGPDVVRWVLGPTWEEAGHIFTLFGPAIGVMLVYNTLGWLHLSLGRADRWLRWGIFEMLVTSGFTMLGALYGPRGVAVAWGVTFCLLFIPGFTYAGRPSGLRVAPVVAVALRFAFAAAGSGLLVFGLFHLTGFAQSLATYSVLTRLAIVSPAFAVMYVAILATQSFAVTFGPIVDFARTIVPVQFISRAKTDAFEKRNNMTERYPTVQKILYFLNTIWTIPLVAMFEMTPAKGVIEKDIDRWLREYRLVDQFKGSRRCGLAWLIWKYPEFRNLLYFRIEQEHHLPSRVILEIAKRTHRKVDTLFIVTPHIGPGLFIQHGYATAIGGERIGANCWINQEVTIGQVKGDGDCPIIGDNVRIAAGAKVFGRITVGDNSIIGANSVVCTNVPPNCTVMGVPAHIIARREDPALDLEQKSS